MNTNSHYKKSINGGKSENKHNEIMINKVVSDSIFPTHIKVNSPPIEKSMTCNAYKYDIVNTINTDLKELPAKPSVINFCIYRVITCRNRSRPEYPFLQYLLYKYPQKNKVSGDIMVFPFIKYKHGSIIKQAAKTTKNITGRDLTIVGFIEYNDQLFLFFDLHETDVLTIDNVHLKKRDDRLWWCLIDEICNVKKVLNFNIHPSVYKTFYTNPALIYLKNEYNKRIETPIVGYYGNYYKFIPIIAALGSQNSVRGLLDNTNLFYFSAFRKSIRYAGWSPLYRERIAYNKKITDIDGKYTKGGVVRFALFLGKVKVPLDDAYDNIVTLFKKKSEWYKRYNSILLGSVDYDGVKLNIMPEYILENYEQYLSLSYHEIDKNTLGATWNPHDENYNIL